MRLEQVQAQEDVLQEHQGLFKMKINEVVLFEADRAAQNAQEINWKQFKTNLAGYAASKGNSDSNRIDAIVWLGLAGHRKAVKLWAPRLGSKAKIKSQAGTLGGFHKSAGGVYNRYIDEITVNPKYGSIYDLNHTNSFILAHELRHRGFNIIRNISALKSQMPNDVDLTPTDGNIMNDEHKMLYAIDGNLRDYGYDEDYWARKYLQCNAIVRNWLSSQPVPSDAPEAFRKDLERIYGKPVEIVAQGEKPKTPVDAIKSGDVKVVQAPEKVAKGAKLPGFIRKLLGLDKKKQTATTPASTGQQTTAAKQSGTQPAAPPAAQPAQQKKAAAAVARVKPKSKSKIGTDAGDGLVWIVAKNSNGFTRVRPDDPRVAQQKAAAGIS